jgi:Uma2 family endonuclease
MTQITTKLHTYEEFMEWFPNDGKRYELHDGEIIEMPPPIGDHEEVTGFLVIQIASELSRLKLPYIIPKTAFVKTPNATSVYSPDVLVVNLANLHNESLWKKESTLTQAQSVPLVVEVVSTNWQDDYHKKFADYELMGIPEYWITDYAGLGGREFIGNPKQPAMFVCSLVDGEYVRTMFRGDNPMVSPTFPQLNLTAQQIFDTGKQ